MRFDAEILRKTGAFSFVSAELVAFVGGGYWLGRKLDQIWVTAPVFVAVLSSLGLVYSVWRIFRISKTLLK